MENNQLDEQYRGLLGSLLQAPIKEDRTGTGVYSLFGRQIRHNMQDGFPLLTTKKVYMKGVQTELKWFLKGETDIKYLLENGCDIWLGDAYRNYREKMRYHFEGGGDVADEKQFKQLLLEGGGFKEFGDMGPIYGKQWRDWGGYTLYPKDDKGRPMKAMPGQRMLGWDQVAKINKELKYNPDSRRMIVSAWNVKELSQMTLPPCHHSWQVWTRPLNQKEKQKHPDKERAISLMWNQRSVDTFLGLPFNIASYGTLLQLLAEEHNMMAYELIGSLGDVHLYQNHTEAAWLQLEREPRALPQLELSNIDFHKGEWDWKLTGYNPHPAIKAQLNVG